MRRRKIVSSPVLHQRTCQSSQVLGPLKSSYRNYFEENFKEQRKPENEVTLHEYIT